MVRKVKNFGAVIDRIGGRRRKSAVPLFIVPVGFFVTLPALVRFDSSLGWSPVVCFGFSILVCIVLIAFYGGVKATLRKRV